MANIYLSNDNLLSIEGLKNSSSGSFMNAATVTVTLKDSGGTSVSGQTFPVTLSYIAQTNGNYQATLENTLSMVEDSIYTATIAATSSGGLYATWDFNLTATKRVV
jgi:hypothetical protein